MASRLNCERCGAGLVPAYNGLVCPRLSACGKGGHEETAWKLRAAHRTGERSGVPA